MSLLRVCGICLVCFGWVSAVCACLVLGWFGDWRNDLFNVLSHSDSQPLSLYFSQRSPAALIAFALFVGVDYYVLRGEEASVAYSRYAIAQCICVFTCISAVILVRALRLRVRHMYYVVIRNSTWSKLLDPSLEKSLSIWIKYKSLITSNRGVVSMILSWVFVMAAFGAAMIADFDLLRQIGGASIILMLVLAIALIFRLPNDDDMLREEMLADVSLSLLAYMMNPLLIVLVEGNAASACVSLTLVTAAYFATFVVSFVWIPMRFTQALAIRNTAQKLEDNTATSKLWDVLSNASQLTKFMKFCCEQFCAENLLALLELKEFKRKLRKELAKELKSAMTSSPRGAANGAFAKDTLSITNNSSACSSESTSMHNALLSKAALDKIELAVDREWTRWDQSVGVRLSQLGCRSSIVNGTGDMRSKALALCEKYVEWDAEFSVNVSYRSRSKVLTLVGKDAAAEVSPLALLFVFDEVALNVFGNLRDVLDRFELRTDLTDVRSDSI